MDKWRMLGFAAAMVTVGAQVASPAVAQDGRQYVRVGARPHVGCAIDGQPGGASQAIWCWNVSSGNGFLCIPNGCVGQASISAHHPARAEEVAPVAADASITTPWGAECFINEYSAVCFVRDYSATADGQEVTIIDPRNNAQKF